VVVVVAEDTPEEGTRSAAAATIYGREFRRATCAHFEDPRAFRVSATNDRDTQLCGICHSDIHRVRDEWGGSTFPMVPGHDRGYRLSNPLQLRELRISEPMLPLVHVDPTLAVACELTAFPLAGE
jgi:hypothetical protein